MLELQHLTIGYSKNTPVLRDISLTLKKGEITAILGSNGCGKSTLLHAIMGEIPYSGNIRCNGLCPKELPPARRAQLLSLLPQQLPTPALTVRETVALGLSPHTIHPGTAEWKKVDYTNARLELTPLAHRSVQTRSGGERQKVFLALTLVQDTPLLLLDEPTTYMDLSFTARFFSILREERAKGKSLLLVMHDVSDALCISDHIAVLQNGSLAFFGTAVQALEQQIPEKLFGLHRNTATREGKSVSFFRGM